MKRFEGLMVDTASADVMDGFAVVTLTGLVNGVGFHAVLNVTSDDVWVNPDTFETQDGARGMLCDEWLSGCVARELSKEIETIREGMRDEE